MSMAASQLHLVPVQLLGRNCEDFDEFATRSVVMLVDAPPILRLHRSKLKIADDSIDREKTQPTLKQRLKPLMRMGCRFPY
jgi:hypothetical protein